MVIRRFEDIESWQVARRLTAEVYEASNQERFGKDFALRDQIRKAAISIMANIAEGFGRKGAPELIRFLTIAQASCIELQSHLYIALDLNYLEQSAFNDL